MERLADVLIGHCCKIRTGERVCIGSVGAPTEMVCILIDRIAEAGGIPFVQLSDFKISRSLYMHASIEQMDLLAKRDIEFMKQIHHYIGLVGEDNSAEMSDVPENRMQIVMRHWSGPVSDCREQQANWTVVRWPSPSMAQLAGMSTEAFEDFYFDACALDYKRMARAAQPLEERMRKADLVRIKGTLDTDISFSIRGVPTMICAGERNLPDGEIFTAPVRDSANGVIHFNAGTAYHGKSFDDVRLVLKNGKAVKATSSNTQALNDILDTDEGARYIGEFSLGFNPQIQRVMRDIMFDEKIAGSLHFTPGQAYEEADNGNRSSIHWDMVLVQTPEFGGGEVYFDGELIRKDGRFVPDYLECLNPENLV